MSANPKAEGEHLPKREKGIILRVEDGYKLCVWSPKDPMTEIRFICQEEDFKPGDFVSFTQNNLTDGVYLDPLELEALPNSFEVIQNPPPLPIQLMVEVAIPPRDCGYYNREEIEALEYGVSFYCYSIEFGKIASFAPLLQEPGKVYKARIGRVLVDQSWVIDKIGTMFVMPAQELEEIQDPDKIRCIARKVPWKNWKPAEQGLMMTVEQAAQMMLDYGIPAHIRDRRLGNQNQNAPAGTSASMPVNSNGVANRPLALTAYPHQGSSQPEHHQQQKDLIDMSLEVFLQEINSSRTQPHSSTPLPTPTGAGRSFSIGNNMTTTSQNGARVRINDFGDEEPKLVKELKNAGISTINWEETPTVENIADEANKENHVLQDVEMDTPPVSNQQPHSSNSNTSRGMLQPKSDEELDQLVHYFIGLFHEINAVYPCRARELKAQMFRMCEAFQEEFDEMKKANKKRVKFEVMG